MAGRALLQPAPEDAGHVFDLDLHEVVWTGLDEARSALVILSWHPGRGVEERMGVPLSVRKRGEPVTEVIIKYRFAVGRFEITRAQFEAFVREAKYEPPNATGCWDGSGSRAPCSA